jgi:hypothetical protein
MATAFGAAAATLPEHAEICRFTARDGENPFLRWLSSQEVTCVAAGAPVVFPPGLWNVFVRAHGTVSVTPMLVEGDAALTTIEPALAPGAILAPLLPEGRTGVVYMPRRGSAIPVDGARITVPADEPLWLFVLDKSTPVAVIPIAPIAPGTERAIDARSGGTSAVIGWLQVPEPERTTLPTITGVSSPTIRAGSRDADPLPSPSLLHGAFFRITEVSSGNAELRVEGRGWLPDRRVVKVQPGITVAAAPLVVRAAGTLTVHWSTEQDLPALDRSLGACVDAEEVQRPIIAIAKCPSPRRGPGNDDAECTAIREEKVDRFYGSITFDDITPGLYRAELRYGKLPPTRAMASVTPLRVADLRLLPFYTTLYGSVTRGGEPLGEDTRLTFPTGPGFAPAETGEYNAVLRPEPVPEESQIAVAACDGSPRAVVITDQPIRPRSRFDVDIPANELIIHVSDTFTRETLPGATVKLEATAVLHAGRIVFTTTSTANEKGDVVWTGVPVRELHLTVTHAGYEKRAIEPFTMPRRDQHTVDAQLVPLRGTRGKIVSDRPFDNSAVVWFSSAGSETERAELAPDGTFVYVNQHTPDETMTVISTSHPLWVVRAPVTERRQSITLAFPNAPAVAFDVWLTGAVPDVTRYIGLTIGGLHVPQPLLADHQTMRRDPSLLRGRGPQHFRDILATAPIDVLLGPLSDEIPTRARKLDLFALPPYATAPRQRLEPGTTDVVFLP